MFISKIQIQGYRNFKDKEIAFREGINVIIGPNNAGKSNLLRALDLVLNTDTPKKLSLYDFCRGCNLDELKAAPPQVRISVFFTESEGEVADSEDLVLVAPCLTKLEHPYEAQITFDYFLPEEDKAEYLRKVSGVEEIEVIWNLIRDEYLRRYVSRMWAGNPVIRARLDGDTLSKFDFEFLAPIRDVERDLFSGKTPLLREVLNFFLDYEIKKDKAKDDHQKEQDLAQKHTDFTSDANKVLESVLNRLQHGKKHILEYASETGASDFQKSKPDFTGLLSESDFLDALQLIIEHETGIKIAATHNGLGYNNLIYMSLLLAKMQANADPAYYRQNARVYSVLAVEEPEAHLHPSLQYKFLRYLKEKQVKTKLVRQLFVTSHSTQISAAVSLDEMICMYTYGKEFRVAYPGQLFTDSEDDQESKQYVQRFLDATKSDMLFADKICFVEGLAEELLMPTFAEYEKKSFEEAHVATITAGGRYFAHFLKLFDTKRNSGAIKKKVACITDRDPVWKSKEGKSSFERCYPFENGKEDYEYEENADALIKQYEDNDTIQIFSQDKNYGKTLEYDLMWCNADSSILLTKGLCNKEELERIQGKDYPACLEELRSSKSNDRIKEALESCSWPNVDKKKALLAARYLNSVGKGANALELSSVLKENLDKKEGERKAFEVPEYIKKAIEWLLQSSSPTLKSE